MQIITLEKYLDSPTTSCDISSKVHDCYILLPSKIHKYFSNQEDGDIDLIDISTNKRFTMQFSKGREYRINQFRQYINEKKITMGDKISLNIIQNNNKNIEFFIDVEHNNFFKLQDKDTHLYNGYLKDSFLKLFDTSHKISVKLDDGSDLEIEKINNQFKIISLNINKFILNENKDTTYTITKLSTPSVSDKQSIKIDDTTNNLNDKKNIKELFKKYIDGLEIKTKKTAKRLEYLETLLPQQINKNNPISLFEITDINELKKIADTLRMGNANWEWDRKYGSEVLQTVGYYIKFLDNLLNFDTKQEEKNLNSKKIDLDSNQFHSFIKRISPLSEYPNLNNIDANILFNIGQPNTGKSYNFEKSQIFSEADIDKNQYLKIPVSGGIGNEYKGLQSTDLAITYDPIKKELKFGEFLQILMSAIVNPSIPHIIFLDDFHNQDISSLLSEYTPLFKAQQKRDIIQPDESDNVYNTSFSDIDEFIDIWNNFIITHCTNTPIVPLTNRISGKSLNLVYPSNFYLLGAANFNENSLNIFADWEDRAKITYKNPIEDFNYVLNEDDKSNKNNIHFLECCKAMNTNLKEILELNNIFDYDRYCFGMWKIIKADGMIINELSEQKKTIIFFFGMIKNSLKFNNKNSYINDIGWQLIGKMQTNEWFKENIESISDIEEIDYKILHKYNIYEDDI